MGTLLLATIPHWMAMRRSHPCDVCASQVFATACLNVPMKSQHKRNLYFLYMERKVALERFLYFVVCIVDNRRLMYNTRKMHFYDIFRSHFYTFLCHLVNLSINLVLNF